MQRLEATAETQPLGRPMRRAADAGGGKGNRARFGRGRRAPSVLMPFDGRDHHDVGHAAERGDGGKIFRRVIGDVRIGGRRRRMRRGIDQDGVAVRLRPWRPSRCRSCRRRRRGSRPRWSVRAGSHSGSSTIRPTMSTVLPAVNGMIARIGFAGQACADASRGSAGSANAAAAEFRNRRRVVMMDPSPVRTRRRCFV